MNERIKELYTEVVGVDKLAFDSYLAEKFAELIVRECASKVTRNEALNILEHFGVK
jgi:hypothetical protein